MRHLLAQLEGAGAKIVAGRFTLNGTTLTLGNIAPLAQANDITATRSATGIYSLVIANFLGPLGVAVPVIACGSPGTMLPLSAIPSYSGSTLTVAIRVGTGGTLAESDVHFQVIAY